MPNLLGIEVSLDVYAANCHLVAQPRATKTTARKEIDAEAKKQFAATFEATWRWLGGPELEREYQFCPDRKWRADYYCETPTGKWILEIEGGIYLGSGGGHRSRTGYVEDVFKYNAAVALGYRVLRIATGMATVAYLESLIKAIRT